jgi:transglutaminase-like putative cysteine protease
VVYFCCSAVLWWWAGMRIHLAGLARITHQLPAAAGDARHLANLATKAGEKHGLEDGGRRIGRSLPRLRHVIVAAIFALILSIPIFLALPRLRSPWIAGRGGAGSVTGFTSTVALSGIGPIRKSHEVAMVVRSVAGDQLREGWMRLRATALERVTTDSWSARGASRVPEYRDGLVWPHGTQWDLEGAVELEIKLENPRRYLFLPEGAIAVSSPVEVRLDSSSGVVLSSRVRGALRYSVWVTNGSAPRATDPPLDRLPRFELNPEVSRLATKIVAGLDTDLARAFAVERFLRQNYTYSMSGMTHLRSDPITWFLLTERQGHCEYFAGAMVALLTDLGIPARMVAGYSGGALSPGGDEAVVREANAHTWVEARVGEGDGWTVFDPTPEASVPSLNRPDSGDRIRWAMDWVQSGWDRYVLTFGLGEQVQLLSAAANGFRSITRPASLRRLMWAAVFAMSVVIVWQLLLRWPGAHRQRKSRGGFPAATAVESAARLLERDGVEVPSSATVRWIAGRTKTRWPAAGVPMGELAWLAERELYSGEERHRTNRAAVRSLWARVRRAMRQATISN